MLLDLNCPNCGNDFKAWSVRDLMIDQQEFKAVCCNNCGRIIGLYKDYDEKIKELKSKIEDAVSAAEDANSAVDDLMARLNR